MPALFAKRAGIFVFEITAPVGIKAYQIKETKMPDDNTTEKTETHDTPQGQETTTTKRTSSDSGNTQSTEVTQTTETKSDSN